MPPADDISLARKRVGPTPRICIHVAMMGFPSAAAPKKLAAPYVIRPSAA
jgi:hypothetical protein